MVGHQSTLIMPRSSGFPPENLHCYFAMNFSHSKHLYRARRAFTDKKVHTIQYCGHKVANQVRNTFHLYNILSHKTGTEERLTFSAR